jgi:hypothetical protein
MGLAVVLVGVIVAMPLSFDGRGSVYTDGNVVQEPSPFADENTAVITSEGDREDERALIVFLEEEDGDIAGLGADIDEILAAAL